MLDWYAKHARDLPWRRTKEPYMVWVSEIMAQQTQIATMLPYYDRWMARFPDVEALATASEQDVLSQWQGLGYYRRCRMLHAAAKSVATAGFPSTAEGWRALPGVGAYTSAAIASICFGEPAAVVDGNVERVYARFTDTRSSGPKLHQATWKWAQSVLNHRRPGDWNQALMELGATVCTPKNPACGACPLQEGCLGYRRNVQHRLPTPEPKAEVVKLALHVWVPVHQGLLGLRQIPSGRWGEGLWEFPSEPDEESLKSLLGDLWPESLGRVRHTVTKHRITLEVSVVRPPERVDGLRWLRPSELNVLPLPSAQRKILNLALQAA